MEPGTQMMRDGGSWLAARRRRRRTVLRCECNDCGVHFHAQAGLVVTGGNCTNCGSYAYDAICVEARGRLNPWTWRRD